MLSKSIKQAIIKDDRKFEKNRGEYKMPVYCPNNHYKHLCKSGYYYALIVLRHYIKIVSDYYLGTKQNAKNIDLFMFTPSVSSPIGPGSDSSPISIKLGRLKIFLVDSSQFGFEPLLINKIDKVYCYLPSMRGEDCDNRHLNQFYHCEMEIKGKIEILLPIIEGYIKILAETILLMENIINKISENSKKTERYLRAILNVKKFPKITFNKAVDILVKNGKKALVNFTKQGNDITCDGEIELMKILISFIYEKEKAFREMFRVLKKRGKIIIMGHGFYNAIASKINNYCAGIAELGVLDNKRIVKWGEHVPELNVFSKESMENDLKQAGFSLDKTYGVPIFVQPGSEDFDPENKKKSRISATLEKEDFFKKVFELEMKYNNQPTVANRGVNMFTVASKIN